MKLDRIYTVFLTAALAVGISALLAEYVFLPSYPVTISYNFPAASTAPLSQPEQPESDAGPSLSAGEVEAQPEEQGAEEESGETPPAVYFPLELNAATAEELMLIPRIGEVTASRILEYRGLLGGYSSLEQLMEIKGIGEKTYQEISAYLYLIGDDWDKARQNT